MNFEIKHGEVTFGFDRYVELYGVLSILSEDQEKICEAGRVLCNSLYIKDVKEYFRRADCLPLTRLLELFSDEYNFNYDAPVWLMLYLSSGTEIDRSTLFYERKTIPDELFDEFLHMLEEFKISSRFDEFYDTHIPMYRELAESFIADYDEYDSHRFLVNLLGITSEHDFRINFMLGVTNANYGVHIDNRVYANLRPYRRSRRDGLPDYSYDPIYYSTLIIHEFAHAFINDMTAEYADAISRISPAKHGDALDGFSYGDSVETLINETVISAIECIYVKDRFPKYYEAYVSEYEADGYKLLRDVISIFSEMKDIKNEYGRIIEIFF